MDRSDVVFDARRHGLWGVSLRYALLGHLFNVHRACSVDELWTMLNERFVLHPSVTRKTVAEAAAYECVRGRARRVARGRYAAGPVSRSIRYRVGRRQAALPHKHEANTTAVPDG